MIYFKFKFHRHSHTTEFKLYLHTSLKFKVKVKNQHIQHHFSYIISRNSIIFLMGQREKPFYVPMTKLAVFLYTQVTKSIEVCSILMYDFSHNEFSHVFLDFEESMCIH